MINDKMKDFLAIENGLTQERYVDKVTEKGKAEFSNEEEHARFRKSIYLMFTLFKEAHPEIVDHPAYIEAMEHYERFEEFKRTSKEDLRINTEGDTTS